MNDAAKALLESSKVEFDALLDELQVDKTEVKVLAQEIAELSIATTIAKLSGQDVSVAERALIASARNLASITSMKVANAVLEFSSKVVLSVSAALLKVVIAAI